VGEEYFLGGGERRLGGKARRVWRIPGVAKDASAGIIRGNTIPLRRRDRRRGWGAAWIAAWPLRLWRVRSQNRIRGAERRYVTVSWRQVRFRGDGAGRRRARISAETHGNGADRFRPQCLWGRLPRRGLCSPVQVAGDSDHGYHGEKNDCREVPCRFAPGIPMMEAAQPGV